MVRDVEVSVFSECILLFSSLSFYNFVEEFHFHCSLSVCVSVCVSVCLWTKFQPKRCTDLDAVFSKWLLTALAQTLLKFVTFSKRSRSQWRNIHFFLHYSLSIALLCISALLCPIKIKYSMPLLDLHLKFIRIELVITSECKWLWQKLKVTDNFQSHKNERMVIFLEV